MPPEARSSIAPPALTVAIPTCDGTRHLANTLRSILAQKGADYELLIVDDRSQDQTLEVAREVAGDRARVVQNPERLGLGANWNRCVELARNEWVTVFHQDDVMLPDHLAIRAQAIAAAGPGLGLVAGSALAVDAANQQLPPAIVEPGWIDQGEPHNSSPLQIAASDEIRFTIFEPGAFMKHLLATNPVRCSGVVLSRSAHQDLGGFNPSLRYVVDWDYWIRVARRYKVAWLWRPATFQFRWHAASETQRLQAGTADLDEQLAFLTQLHSPAPLSSEARRRLARAYLNRAYMAARSGEGARERRCLKQALQLWRGILGVLATSPRLSARLLVGAIGGSKGGAGAP